MVRPKGQKGEVRASVIPVRFTISEHDEIKKAAKGAFMPVATLIRVAAMEWIRESSRDKNRKKAG